MIIFTYPMVNYANIKTSKGGNIHYQIRQQHFVTFSEIETRENTVFLSNHNKIYNHIVDNGKKSDCNDFYFTWTMPPECNIMKV